MLKVTFAVPAYNHAAYVVQTLDSIWTEGYPNKEIVIVDDGSSDTTAQVIKDWCTAKNWQNIIFISRPNKGITATLNEIIKNSTGDYLRLFSSDDIACADATQKMVNALAADAKLMAVFGDAPIIDAQGSLTHESALNFNGANKQKLLNRASLAEEIISNWAVSGPVLLIKKSFFEKYGLYDETMLIDDWDLYTRLVAMGGLQFLDAPVAHYRIHDTNTCKTKDKAKRVKNLRSQASVVDRNIKLFSSRRLQSLFLAEKYFLLAAAEYRSDRYFACGFKLLAWLKFKVKAVCLLLYYKNH